MEYPESIYLSIYLHITYLHDTQPSIHRFMLRLLNDKIQSMHQTAPNVFFLS